MYEILKKLVNISAVSGREKGLRAEIQKLIAPYADKIYTDSLGNLIAVKKGSSAAPLKIMLAAHMDEVGFIVTCIEDSGIIRFGSVGATDPVYFAYKDIVFENGLCGVLVPDGDISPADYKINKFYADIGAADKKEAERKVNIGDCFTLRPNIRKLCGKRICGRPFDDRAGCAVLIETARRLMNNPDDIYFVFTSQEEVGCRGALTAAFDIQPDYALALDVTLTGDIPGAEKMAVKLGGGAAIKIKDSSVICDVGFVSILKKLAQSNKIPHQTEILNKGGTDTSSMQMSGCGAVAGALSIPARYCHSGVETIDMGDAEACVKLTLALIENEIK